MRQQIRRYIVRDGENVLDVPLGSELVGFIHDPTRPHFLVLARGPEDFDEFQKKTVLVRRVGEPFNSTKALKSIGSAVVTANSSLWHAMEKPTRRPKPGEEAGHVKHSETKFKRTEEE